jgi:ribosomal protein S18 acetylase RimI-like enzyme
MFQRVATDRVIASQVAALLNTHNKLNTKYNVEDILMDKNTYIVETLNHTVLACVQIRKQAYILSEIRHLSVTPAARHQGIGKTLVSSALISSPTPIVYATIRKDNIASIKTFESCGFVKAGIYTTGTRDIFLYVATCQKWKKKVDNPTNSFYNDDYRR